VGTVAARVPEMPASVHALAYWPVQICDACQKPSLMTVSLTLSLVTATGVSSTDGTSLVSFFTVVAVPEGALPCNRSYAICAACSASGLIALYTVMYCSPARIRWIAASSASWPVTGGSGLNPAPFIAAMAPPAVPSLAAYTPTILSLPSAVIACSISRCALSGLHCGVSYSLPRLTLPSSTLCAPFLNNVALLSVGSPLIMTVCPTFALSPRACSSASPCSLPTRSLSNEMYASMGPCVSRS
jgi:hypothetical protein